MDSIFKDSDILRYAVRRTNRTYFAEVKAELLAACSAPGTSIAAVANAHGMNANVLHRWLKESSQSWLPIGRGVGTSVTTLDIAGQKVRRSIVVPLLMRPAEPVECEIKVAVCKGGRVMTASWPMSAASEFAYWSASILK